MVDLDHGGAGQPVAAFAGHREERNLDVHASLLPWYLKLDDGGLDQGVLFQPAMAGVGHLVSRAEGGGWRRYGRVHAPLGELWLRLAAGRARRPSTL